MIKSFFPRKNISHQLILLYGFHFNFIFIFTLAVMRDLYFHGYFNAMINFSALSTAIISYYFLHFKSQQLLSTNLILIVAIVPLYALIYLNDFGNLVVIYIILLPLATFFLYNLRRAIVINVLIYGSLFALLYFIAQTDPNEPTLHNIKALINIAFASILIAFFGIFYHIAIESTLNKLIETNRQKDLLLKEVHHRVKNNLNITASILGLQTKGKEAIIKEELLKSKTRIESIALVHEMLYQHEDFEYIVFNEYVNRIKNLIIPLLSDESILLELEPNNDLTVTLDKMIQFGLIINELFTNSFKHSNRDKPLHISISLQKEKGNYLFLYKDNADKNIKVEHILKSKSLGIKLIKLSVKQLRADMSLSVHDGLEYKISFRDD